jgi:hypothetical protein
MFSSGSAMKMLGEAGERVRGGGTELWLAALNPEAPRVVERPVLGKALVGQCPFFDLGHALARYVDRPPG